MHISRIKMGTRTFVYDVIVKHFEPSDNKYGEGLTDPAELEVTVQFNGKSIGLSKSRINVEEFKANSGLEFSGVPKKMRQNLEECGMPVQLKYGGKVVGTGLISLPQTGIDQIDENMSDWIFNGSCNVEMEGNVVGKVEILSRLIIKCDEPTKYVDNYNIYICTYMYNGEYNCYCQCFIGTIRDRVKM